MSNGSLVNARQLALQLAALDAASRTALLAELPVAKQEELNSLMSELEPLQAEFPSFEMVMADLEIENPSGMAGFNESQLQQLLTGETFAVKQQLVHVLSRNANDRVTPHVKAVIAGYLQKKSKPEASVALTNKPWWRIWG